MGFAVGGTGFDVGGANFAVGGDGADVEVTKLIDPTSTNTAEAYSFRQVSDEKQPSWLSQTPAPRPPMQGLLSRQLSLMVAKLRPQKKTLSSGFSYTVVSIGSEAECAGTGFGVGGDGLEAGAGLDAETEAEDFADSYSSMHFDSAKHPSWLSHTPEDRPLAHGLDSRHDDVISASLTPQKKIFPLGLSYLREPTSPAGLGSESG